MPWAGQWVRDLPVGVQALVQKCVSHMVGNLDSYRHLPLATHCWGIDRRKTEIQEHDRMLLISVCFSLAGGAQNNLMGPSRSSCHGCLGKAEEAEPPLSL